jgi:hypothetical protein
VGSRPAKKSLIHNTHVNKGFVGHRLQHCCGTADNVGETGRGVKEIRQLRRLAQQMPGVRGEAKGPSLPSACEVNVTVANHAIALLLLG